MLLIDNGFKYWFVAALSATVSRLLELLIAIAATSAALFCNFPQQQG